MGTRNLTIVQIDGAIKVAQYGQWDGYPAGTGLKIKYFIHRIMESDEVWQLFTRKLRACSWLSKEEYTQRWIECGADIENNRASPKARERHIERYRENNRDTGAEILELILEKSDGLKLQNEYRFAAESLWCEWAYVLDMDHRILEVYHGHNERPLPDDERFASLAPMDANTDGTVYYPVRLVRMVCFPMLVQMRHDEFADETTAEAERIREDVSTAY